MLIFKCLYMLYHLENGQFVNFVVSWKSFCGARKFDCKHDSLCYILSVPKDSNLANIEDRRKNKGEDQVPYRTVDPYFRLEYLMKAYFGK